MIMKILTFILLIFFNSFVLADPLKNAIESEIRSVSYTHLTLPTIE